MPLDLNRRFVADVIEPLGFETFECHGPSMGWRKMSPIDIRIYAIFRSNLKVELEFYKGYYPQTRAHIKKELELDLNDPTSHRQLLTSVKDFIDES